ncbi:MAG TPA: hydroxymethylglutaryl-CoA synthase [Thermofilaceae archaeon]|nr:hydroxymethylglutaryl-CoA synthase [Thermofilaceae archaeon]
MKFSTTVGIAGYGGYVPQYRVKCEEIARVWESQRAPIREKSVPNLDEDSLTMAYEAAKMALRMAGVEPGRVGAVLVGSESPPYAVKPTATVVAEALGVTPQVVAIDMEFACKAGTTAMILAAGLVASGAVAYGLAIGTDDAQARPSDELEYTAGAGAAAFLISRRIGECVALIEHAYSYVTDTTDFWRREGQRFPSHTFRFTGAPAYFHHVIQAAKSLMEEAGLRPSDFNHVVFHQPNVKFPLRAARYLGFSRDQVKVGLLSGDIGNTYAASSLLGLVRVLDEAEPGDRILVVSFGSGAGSDAISLVATKKLSEKRSLLRRLLDRKVYVDYAKYSRLKRILGWGW